MTMTPAAALDGAPLLRTATSLRAATAARQRPETLAGISFPNGGAAAPPPNLIEITTSARHCMGPYTSIGVPEEAATAAFLCVDGCVQGLCASSSHVTLRFKCLLSFLPTSIINVASFTDVARMCQTMGIDVAHHGAWLTKVSAKQH